MTEPAENVTQGNSADNWAGQQQIGKFEDSLVVAQNQGGNQGGPEKPNTNQPPANEAPDKPPYYCKAQDNAGQGYGYATKEGYLWNSQEVVKYAKYDCQDSAGKKFSFSGPGTPDNNSYTPYGVKEEYRYNPSSGDFVFIPEPPETFKADPANSKEFVPEFWQALNERTADCRTAGTCAIKNPPSNK